MATVPEILPCAARLNDKRSATGRIYASACSSTGSRAFASADTIRFTVSVAAASNSAGWQRRVDRRRICVGAGSSISLSRINCRLVNERSHIYPEHAITATRKRGLISARRRLRLQVIAQR